MSDEHPVDEPGPATPAWAAVPTMPWERVPDQRRGDLDNAPTSPPVDRYPPQDDPRYDPRREDPRRDWDDPRRGEQWRGDSRQPGPPPRRPYDGYPGRPPAPQGRTYGTPPSGYDEGYRDERREPVRPAPRQQQQPLPPQVPHRQGPPPPRPARPRDDELGRDEWARDGWGRDNDRGRPPRDDRRRDDDWARGAEWSRDDRTRDDRTRDDRAREEWARDDRARDERARDEWGRDDRPRDEWSRDERTRDDRARDEWARDDRARGEWGRDEGAGRDEWSRDDQVRDDRGWDERGRDDRGRGRGGPDPGGRRTHPDAPTSGYPVQPTPPPGRGPGRTYGTPATSYADEPTETTGELPRVEAPDASPASGTPFSVSPAGPSYTAAPLTRAGVDGLQATGYLPIVRPGAAGFPPELAAVARTVRQPEEAPAALEPAEPPPAPEPEPAPDPEQQLAGFEWRFDPDTLREQIEGDEVTRLEEIRDQLTAKLNGVSDNPTRARLLSLRAVVSRILGDLLKAFADGKLALAHAEATGELRRIAIAQARLAHVLQFRGEYEEADRLFTLANSSELPDRLRATMHQHAGRCAYDQGRYMESCNHFERALDLRKEEDPELIAQTELALDAVFRRVAEKGWGPYPRSREEILQLRKPPAPAFDEDTQRWGFTDAEFNFCIGPGYVDVQPFRDGVAWVQRQGSETWELIDDTGRSLIDPSAGYLGVSSFSDGLAWVSRDGTTRWIAIDKANTVLISTGFDDVRPFRRGVAAVRRGHRWGAVDSVGRMVVPFQFDGFATALHDGRYIDGFSDEGLAVVSLSGRKGVVDRAGRVIVPPVHHLLMIHPVAFLVADEAQRWGALDRRGRMIIEQTFPSRMGVTDEIDRLLADTRPVM